ncbi:MAG: ABC transporter substrate-binding protein [Deltaproteobacteria bacterium]|nr:ABC transporter substrate-binding protein [Deltaproteobacteria bacterium]MBI3390681.1 ABC transporter substrate-binding protein [Deltaproteobacteria bacterium]
MRAALRRLGLGVVLILAVSLLLLLSDNAKMRSQVRPDEARRLWKVHILELVSSIDSDENERGMREGLASRLVEGRDYTVTIRNAQGDMPTLSGIVDAAVGDGADLLMTLSTPTLQTAVQRVKTLPIIFSFSSNPIGAGAGRTYDDHLPNVTGVPTTAAYEDILGLIHELLPNVRRLGTLVVPAEVNSVFNTKRVVEAAAKRGFEFATVAVNSSSELSDATLALLAQNVDAICQVGSNLTISGFASIVRSAQQAHVPVFGFLTSDAKNGAVAVIARDSHESGWEAGLLAARVIQGESPANIPFHEVPSSKLVLNLAAAKIAGIAVPERLRRQAATLLE